MKRPPIATLDGLIIMQNNETTEQGTHKELVAIGGIYADLWERQSGGFISSPLRVAS